MDIATLVAAIIGSLIGGFVVAALTGTFRNLSVIRTPGGSIGFGLFFSYYLLKTDFLTTMISVFAGFLGWAAYCMFVYRPSENRRKHKEEPDTETQPEEESALLNPNEPLGLGDDGKLVPIKESKYRLRYHR